MFVVTSYHDDQVDQTETEIFKDSIAMRVDWNALERSILLALNVNLQHLVLMNVFVHFNTAQSICSDWGHFTATSTAMAAGIKKTPRLGRIRSA